MSVAAGESESDTQDADADIMMFTCWQSETIRETIVSNIQIFVLLFAEIPYVVWRLMLFVSEDQEVEQFFLDSFQQLNYFRAFLLIIYLTIILKY